MKVILTGSKSQLGRALNKMKPENVELFNYPKNKFDITNFKQSEKIITELEPDIIINTAAYTAVEKAEEEEDYAYATNAYGVENLAKIIKERNILLIHISTDYVFDGEATEPYKETDKTNPKNIYGNSKLKGEQLALQILEDDLLIIRTSWLYSLRGPSFLSTMVRLLEERESIEVVNDQFGTPTSSMRLAEVIFQSVKTHLRGLYNFSDLGSATWYDFAVAIRDILVQDNPNKKYGDINPVSSDFFSSRVNRPHYSVLDKTKIINSINQGHINWQEALEREILCK